MNRVAVIGAGIMGSGIAQAIAMGGKEVKLYDVSEEGLQRALANVLKNMQRIVRSGRMTEKEMTEMMARIEPVTKLEDACQNVNLIIEAIPENLEAKQQLFATLDRYADATVLFATNTSELSVTAIASATKRPTQVAGMHWFNPAPVMKLVEIVRGVDTSDVTIEAMERFAQAVGKETVVVKDMQGFVTSRAIAVHLLECMRMFEEGVASKEEIDKAICLGLNYPMGPFALADYVGLDTMLFASHGLTEAYGERFRAPQILVKLVEAGHLGRKTGRGFYDYAKERESVR